ncbi:hypothetical protein [Niabella beijingensis]|uniref:hypothetical protein n=1 Tax=Niabella beijingensis TaxID=2872700 RepID=UPI001CBB34B6|nr:hypothetical protein [Niabella beijingensis]MBZ4191923.1 hypothetical protein [Niabella beijingensis]
MSASTKEHETEKNYPYVALVNPIVFGLVTLASFNKDVDDIYFGFPEIFYLNTQGVSPIPGRIGSSISFRLDEFLRDLGFALIITLVLVLLYARFKRRKLKALKRGVK